MVLALGNPKPGRRVHVSVGPKTLADGKCAAANSTSLGA